MMFGRMFLVVFIFIATSCAHGLDLVCVEGDSSDEVLLRTARMFIESEGEDDYDEVQYKVIEYKFNGCSVVAVDFAPNSLDSEALVFIDRYGVVRATSPSGEPFFDIRGDRYYGLRPSKRYPLQKLDGE